MCVIYRVHHAREALSDRKRIRIRTAIACDDLQATLVDVKHVVFVTVFTLQCLSLSLAPRIDVSDLKWIVLLRKEGDKLTKTPNRWKRPGIIKQSPQWGERNCLHYIAASKEKCCGLGCHCTRKEDIIKGRSGNFDKGNTN